MAAPDLARMNQLAIRQPHFRSRFNVAALIWRGWIVDPFARNTILAASMWPRS